MEDDFFRVDICTILSWIFPCWCPIDTIDFI